jgi:hypothetical protein
MSIFYVTAKMVVFKCNMFSSRCELFCHSYCGLIILMDFTKEVGLFMCTGKIVCDSFISVISGIVTSRNADDIAMYSALAVLRAISVWS